jgi:hypothetical protein
MDTVSEDEFAGLPDLPTETSSGWVHGDQRVSREHLRELVGWLDGRYRRQDAEAAGAQMPAQPAEAAAAGRTGETQGAVTKPPSEGSGTLSDVAAERFKRAERRTLKQLLAERDRLAQELEAARTALRTVQTELGRSVTGERYDALRRELAEVRASLERAHAHVQEREWAPVVQAARTWAASMRDVYGPDLGQAAPVAQDLIRAVDALREPVGPQQATVLGPPYERMARTGGEMLGKDRDAWQVKARKWRKRARAAEAIAEHRLELVKHFTERWPTAQQQVKMIDEIVEMVNNSQWRAESDGATADGLVVVDPGNVRSAVKWLLDRLDASV